MKISNSMNKGYDMSLPIDVKFCNDHKKRMADFLYYYAVTADNKNRGVWLIFSMPWWRDAALSRRSIKRDDHIYTRRITEDEQSIINSSSSLLTWHYKVDQLDGLIADEAEIGMREGELHRFSNIIKSAFEQQTSDWIKEQRKKIFAAKRRIQT